MSLDKESRQKRGGKGEKEKCGSRGLYPEVTLSQNPSEFS
jgi:hypothetical protein